MKIVFLKDEERAEKTLVSASAPELLGELVRRYDNLIVALKDSDESNRKLLCRLEGIDYEEPATEAK